MKISETLSKLISQHGLNTLELSRRTGIGQPVIYRIMSGETDNPKIETMLALANYFGMTVNQLIGEAPLPGEEKKSATKQLKGIPVIDWKEIESWPLGEEKLSKKERVISEFGDQPHLYALKMNDESMEPLFGKDSVLIIDRNKTPKDGQYVVVKHQKHKSPLFRQLVVDDDFQYLKPLSPDSEKYKMTLLKKNDKFYGVLIQSKRDY